MGWCKFKIYKLIIWTIVNSKYKCKAPTNRKITLIFIKGDIPVRTGYPQWPTAKMDNKIIIQIDVRLNLKYL